MRHRAVRRHPDFEVDFAAQLRWLEERKERAWIQRLADELEGVTELLSSFPGAGRLVAEDGPVALRQVVLRQLPYLVWYAYDRAAPRAEVWLLRLFHARQDQPTPQLVRGRR